MPDFPTTYEIALAAIVELVNVYRQGRGGTPYLQRLLTNNGNGVWAQEGTSDYFNCGINDHVNTLPPIGDNGSLSRADGGRLVEWFNDQYGTAGDVDVLQATGHVGWNFTLVIHGTGTAFNFHLVRH
jgi:hypothetical protein